MICMHNEVVFCPQLAACTSVEHCSGNIQHYVFTSARLYVIQRLSHKRPWSSNFIIFTSCFRAWNLFCASDNTLFIISSIFYPRFLMITKYLFIMSHGNMAFMSLKSCLNILQDKQCHETWCVSVAKQERTNDLCDMLWRLKKKHIMLRCTSSLLSE